jgi:hypothetical protein
MSSVDGMYHLSDGEWADRLDMLGRFCRAVSASPDRMIAEARADRAAKNVYMRRLRRFAADLHAPGSRAAHDAENVVRSFFIHNGARVFVRPYQVC